MDQAHDAEAEPDTPAAASGVDTVDSPGAPDEGLPPPSAPPNPPERPAEGAVLGGVALDLARRFGVDPLWPRLAFVVLALLDGFGVVAYLGLWLVLIVGQRPGRGALRIVGVTVLIGSLFLLDDIEGPWIDSPWWLAAVLAGVAIALWAPRGVPVTADPVSDRTLTADRVGVATAPGEPPPPREPSVLGRSVLGLAVVAAAVGALIDQLNGGRLHPEQWLGAAAAICGVGVVIGAWRGRALWLIAPGLLFAGAGFVSGHAARAGVDSLSMGDEHNWIDALTTNETNSTRLSGVARLTVLEAPAVGPQRSELRVGIGEIEIDMDDDATMEVRAVVHDGEVRVNGRVRDQGTFTVGAEGEPDVIVDAEISLGDVDIEIVDMEGPIGPILEPPPWLGDDPALLDGVIDIGDGLQLASDGTVLLPDGFGAIGPNGELWTPYSSERRADGVRVISTDFGDYLLLPNEMIITPGGILVDVPARRAELLEPTTVPREATEPTEPTELTEPTEPTEPGG